MAEGRWWARETRVVLTSRAGFERGGSSARGSRLTADLAADAMSVLLLTVVLDAAPSEMGPGCSVRRLLRSTNHELTIYSVSVLLSLFLSGS